MTFTFYHLAIAKIATSLSKSRQSLTKKLTTHRK